MRRFLVALLGAASLGGCVSMVEGMYDDHAREECYERGGNVSACYEDVERNRRAQRERGGQ